jgi:hypothetical protein
LQLRPFAWKLLQLLEAPLLFLQQALLALADQLTVARRLRQRDSGKRKTQPYGPKKAGSHF